MASTAELTVEYIKEHPSIKSCLKKGLINYSVLARLIAKGLDIEKKSSTEAILVAARRYQEKLKVEANNDEKIQELLTKSELQLKNRIAVIILEKRVDYKVLEELQHAARREQSACYVLEGTSSHTIITQENLTSIIKRRVRNAVIKETKGLALITLRSAKSIEGMSGVIGYLTSLFAENGINIIEFLSCWTDTLFVIDAKDVPKTIDFLKF